jgi:hypothetical protein
MHRMRPHTEAAAGRASCTQKSQLCENSSTITVTVHKKMHGATSLRSACTVWTVHAQLPLLELHNRCDWLASATSEHAALQHNVRFARFSRKGQRVTMALCCNGHNLRLHVCCSHWRHSTRTHSRTIIGAEPPDSDASAWPHRLAAGSRSA